MAFTTTDLENLETAIATGTLTVMINGYSRTYRTMDDLLKAHDFVRRSLNEASAASQGGSTLYSLADWSETE